MKTNRIMLALVFMLAAAPAMAQAEKEKAANKDEAVIMPDVEMLDVPTAGILDYGGFLIKTRFYSDGGTLGGMSFGVMERLNLGVSMAVDKLVGSASPVKMRKPEIAFKFRFYDGGYYIPSLAVGFEGQGYYYNPATKKYMERGKGMYLVGSKEVGVSNLVLHGGFNVPDFDNNYLFGFAALNYTLEDKLAFIFEYDNLFHTDDPSRFNAGTRVYITPYFQLDMGLRDIGRNTKFPNGGDHKAERIVQLRYNTSF